MNKTFQPIFILGVGRSGTSLLQSMLNAHSQIAFTPETHFIRYYLSKKINWENAKESIVNDKYLHNLDIDISAILNNTKNAKDFYIQALNIYLKKKGKQFIGDKDPKNIEYLKTIKSYFPNALIIHIYRDPRAVIASRLKAEWSKNNPLWQHILAYKAQINYFRKNRNSFHKNTIDVCYENLLAQPENELKRIVSMLGLQFEEGMLNYFNSANEVVKGKEKAWKENVYKPIMSENTEKWKKELNPKTIAKIEKALYNEMQRLYYPFTHSSWFHSKFYSILSELYCKKSCR